jgi:hypothetical protein
MTAQLATVLLKCLRPCKTHEGCANERKLREPMARLHLGPGYSG